MKEKIANEIEIENERDKNLYMQGYEQAQKILDELKCVRPDKLKGEAKKLFEAIMRIADDRDKLKQEFDSVDHECSRLEQKEIELEKENKQIKQKR